MRALLEQMGSPGEWEPLGEEEHTEKGWGHRNVQHGEWHALGGEMSGRI